MYYNVEGCSKCIAVNKCQSGVDVGSYLKAGVGGVLKKKLMPRLLLQEIQYIRMYIPRSVKTNKSIAIQMFLL